MFKTVNSGMSGVKKPALGGKKTIHSMAANMAMARYVDKEKIKQEQAYANVKKSHQIDNTTRLKNEIYNQAKDQKENDIDAGFAKDITNYQATEKNMFATPKVMSTHYGTEVDADQKLAIDNARKETIQLEGSNKSNFGNIYQNKNDFKKKIDPSKDFKSRH
jgi:hypothetical protein